VPLYEFECGSCGERFEELAHAGARVACPACRGSDTRRLYSPIAGRQKWHLDRRFAAESNARRAEREARRRARFAEQRKRRAEAG
jgi:putative FmdB family regulatory protein